MPEVLHPTENLLPTFPDGQGKGSTFVPLPQDTEKGVARSHAIQTINADADSLYKLWRNVTFAPRWQEYIVSVEEKSSAVSHWVIGNPDDADGKRIEFDSEITERIPGRKIAWRNPFRRRPIQRQARLQRFAKDEALR